MDGQAALWAAILASGVYHGLNPGMGWPLAVAAGLTERRGAAVARTLAPLAAGHLLSISVVLLPFGALTVLLDWTREIRIAAGLVIIGFSGVLLLYPRHPRWLARVRPTQVTLWSFSVALLHGAGLMLVPMLLGLCGQVRRPGARCLSPSSTTPVWRSRSRSCTRLLSLSRAGLSQGLFTALWGSRC